VKLLTAKEEKTPEEDETERRFEVAIRQILLSSSSK
jgi:hypothetical protein